MESLPYSCASLLYLLRQALSGRFGNNPIGSPPSLASNFIRLSLARPDAVAATVV